MRRTRLLHRHLITTLMAVLLPVSAAYASGDMSCDPISALRQPSYMCGGVPILSPGNDTRINAMLLMVDSSRLSPVFPDPQSVPLADRTNQLVVPFAYDFSGWINIGQKMPDTSSDTSDGASPSNLYADGEGSICLSDASGSAAFNDAVHAAKDLPADDATRLIAGRAAFECAAGKTGTVWTKPSDLKSAPGRQFATYVDGAYAFYESNFVSASKAFADASHSTNPWLRETALYMAGRAQLNAAQAGAFDANSYALDSTKVNKLELGAADTVFRAYLKVYPRGRYAASATGLQRRVAWLGSNTAQQATLYSKAFANWSPSTSNVPLVQLANELDSKLLQTSNLDTSQLESPSVLAIVDLMRMRASGGDSDSSRQKSLTLNELQAQKPRFASAPALYDYLVAAWYVYLGHKPEQALALLPQAPAASLDYFGLSQQTLRGFALEDSGQADQARQLWAELIPLAKHRLQREALELALAINLEQARLLDRVFADDSPIQNAAIRAILLYRGADADLLRAQAQNTATSRALRDIALYTLLYKELTRTHYADFIADLALIPATPSDALKPFALSRLANDGGYACPSVRDIATTLQQDPGDAKGLNCLAEFVRTYPAAGGLDEYPVVTVVPPAPAGTENVPVTLGSMPSQFPGGSYQRMSSYQKVIGTAQAPSDDRAYALYRAINCFAPGGFSECGGNDIPKSARKQWFTTLKSEYPRSKWAQSSKYYW
ncbi:MULTISPECIES: hypothetical protein [Paraburkholderia]|uniref:hypothetical protein n=1 Tax=Paraburkholderia TaxID=1822464 RepID=UPI002252F571|nr:MULTISPECIES: hypothetical protein [Paraburkholderia]MCX4160455.1 hypothetical protein [Paraburkholderia megapolitana]MDN7155953.1 hypothetical protein [Paraburkholderia sp. CHISQ3]MDQ6492997.1 hypothetical protein [Paraburkholderia megapolitana]